jgi:hypothetical protein
VRVNPEFNDQTAAIGHIYVPSEIEPRAVVDNASWPFWGRIGYCRSGEDWEDHTYLWVRKVKLQPLIWEIEVMPRYPEPDEISDLFNAFDNDEWLRDVFERNPIEWAPARLDDLVERRVFRSRHNGIDESREFAMSMGEDWDGTPWADPAELREGDWTEAEITAAKAWPVL